MCKDDFGCDLCDRVVVLRGNPLISFCGLVYENNTLRTVPYRLAKKHICVKCLENLKQICEEILDNLSNKSI